MDQKKLQSLLKELHQELGSTSSVDAQSRQMLEQVLLDIQQLTPVQDGSANDLTAQLREAALRIESEHPRLAAVLGQLGDTLAKLGI